jgi:anti-sigma factor RsiW
VTMAGDLNCAGTLERLDAWLDRELPPAERDALARHLETCPVCSGVLANRSALRGRLRRVARSEIPAPDLAGRIRSHFAVDESPSRTRRGFLAAAAMVLVSAGTYSAWKSGHLRITAAAREDYIASLVPGVAPVMRIGLQQHVHCAVFRTYPAQSPGEEELASGLGASYAALAPVLQTHVPGGFRVVMAHRCEYKNRPYIHVVARQDGDLISLLITRRADGEAFGEYLRAVANEGGTPVYSSGVSRFSIAGFETPEHLIYLVSDLSQDANAAVFERMTGSLRTVVS